jgi:predicted dehydrogenase
MKVGVVGVGVAGASHLFDLVSDDRFSVVAVGASRIDRARRAADLFNVPLAFADPAIMFETGELDGVVVATPPSVTAGIVGAALRAGLPTLIDKPAAASADELEAVDRNAHHTRAAVAYNRRYLDHVIQGRAILSDGRLGVLTTIGCEWRGPFEQRFATGDTFRAKTGWGHGVLLDTVSHIIDMLLYLGVGPLVAERAVLATSPTGADTGGRIALQCVGSEPMITLRIVDDPLEDWRVEIRGTGGHLTVSRSGVSGRCRGQTIDRSAAETRRPVDDLLDLADGRPALGATLTEAIDVLRVIDQIRAVAHHGRRWSSPRAKALGRLNGSC